jgi:hypothetical protein
MCLSCTESLGRRGRAGGGDPSGCKMGDFFFLYVIGLGANNRGVLII